MKGKKCIVEETFEVLGKLNPHERFVVSQYFNNEISKQQKLFLFIGIGLGAALILAITVGFLV